MSEAVDTVPQRALAELIADISRPRLAGALLGRLVNPPVIGLLIAWLMRSPMRARWMTTRTTRLHARLLRLSRGRLRRSWLFAAGQPVLALTTTGRRTGRARTTAVAAFTHRGTLAIAGMNLGLERNPGWSYNLIDIPQALISVNHETIPVFARPARGGQHEELWQRWLTLQPSAEAFATLAGRDIPIFVLEPRPDQPEGD